MMHRLMTEAFETALDTDLIKENDIIVRRIIVKER